MEYAYLWIGLTWLIQFSSPAKYQIPRPHRPVDPVVYPPDYCQQMQTNEEFDYIVVGSGPAGATVARRLAENPNDRVLLLEAGDDPKPSSDFYEPSPTPAELWNLTTKPSTTMCAGHRNMQCFLTLSKIIAGCSTINAEMYIRGNPQDYEDWEARGNPGWGFADMFPYFLKLENLDDPYDEAHTDIGYHSVGGPFTTAPFPLDPHSQDLRNHLEAGIAYLGYPLNNDVNGAKQIGFGSITGLVERTGYRNNVAKSYLLNNPDNLKVCKKSLVEKVKLTKDKTVEGAVFTYTPCDPSGSCATKKMTAKAKKDYILAGGPINTPQILERSGIGEKSVLEKAGVKVIHELKGVGNNLQEQFLNLGCIFDVDLNNAVARNPLTAFLTSFTGFFNLTNLAYPVPDIQFFFITGFPAIEVAYNAEITKQFEAIKDPVTFGSTILRQTNRGYVHITGTNPLNSPDFNPKQYTSDEEAELTTKACRLARDVFNSPPLRKFKAKPIIVEPCKKYKFNSKKEILCGAQTIPLPLYHYSGTAAMGPKSDEMAVVDKRLKVHGINKLRIVDLSVMPDGPRGNTEIPTIAVAEHAADIIKEDNFFD